VEALQTVRRRSPVWFAAVMLASAAVGLLAQDWIAGVGLWVLCLGWRYLRSADGPPVLAMAFTFQWVQVTVGMYYYAVTGNTLQALDVTVLADYRPMVLIGLGCLLALLVGLRGGMWVADRLGAKPATGPEQAFSWRPLILLYVASVAVTETAEVLAWQVPGLTQGIFALTYVRFALLFLIFRRLSQPRIRWPWIAVVLAGEIVFGFTGYFAGFRESIMMATAALTSAFDRRKVKHWLVLGALGTVTILTALLWMGIRGEYRQDFESEVFEHSREARLDRIAELTVGWAERSLDDIRVDVEFFLTRLWAIHYPALALVRVPVLVPHENGAILWQAVSHLLTPRLFFPDKPVLASDSETVFKYAGVLVAGAGERSTAGERNTSIAFGYAGESYVDFGVPLMFVPVLVYGLLMGAVYRWMFALIWHRELAVALVTVCFWLSLYLFERSWIRMLGLSVTLFVYLGGATLLLDRFLRWRRRERTGRFPARPAPDAVARHRR
jgi:hypothetical protein